MANHVREALIASLVLLVFGIAALYATYNYTGWSDFAWTNGATPAWPSPDVTRLRFKEAVFTVKRGDGAQATLDVTAVLNGMALGLTGSRAPPPALRLTGPLNAFSFVIPGFNDRATVADPGAAPWCSRPAAACAAGPCPYNACGEAGVCAYCPGAPVVTLTGKYKTI